MKNLNYILLIGFFTIISGCSLNENPPFLSNESAFATLDNAQSTLDGVYNSFAQYGSYGNDYHYVTDGNSGYFVSGKGNRNSHPDNLNLCSLKPLPNATHIENVWQLSYQTIGRANDVIASVDAVENPPSEYEVGLNDILGQAYFIRAFTYFNLVRLWGDIPLRLQPTNVDNVHLAKSPAKLIYDQIISDADMAKSLMFDVSEQRLGYPARPAASMLKAKVFMHLATADPSLQDQADYWTLAYNEAQEVYGKYSLVSDFGSLWTEADGNNTQESIFEIQFNEIQSSNFVRLWTASNATAGATWGRLKANPEVYDLHAATYPGDSRIDETFKSEYINYSNGSTRKSYPSTTRSNFAKGFPFIYKYWEKNSSNPTTANQKNFIVYRYADLLLMLSEISNELQNGEELGYVTEVLNRAGVIPHVDYNGGQDSFRQAIMREYQFELLGEGHEWFNNRRRGYDYFRNSVIVPHNTAPTFEQSVDVTLLDGDESVMELPIPSSEINTNQEINN